MPHITFAPWAIISFENFPFLIQKWWLMLCRIASRHFGYHHRKSQLRFVFFRHPNTMQLHWEFFGLAKIKMCNMQILTWVKISRSQHICNLANKSLPWWREEMTERCFRVLVRRAKRVQDRCKYVGAKSCKDWKLLQWIE